MTTRRGRTSAERAPAGPTPATEPEARDEAAPPPEPAQERSGLVPAVVVGRHRWTASGRVRRRHPLTGREVLTLATVGEAGDGELIEVSPAELERGIGMGTLMRPEDHRRHERARQEADELRRRLADLEREHGQL